MLALSAVIARAEPAAMRELAQRDAAVSVGTRSSAVALGVAQLLKFVEDALQVLGVDADAGI